MRFLIILFLFFSVKLSAQIELWQLEYAPDSSYVVGALSGGEPTWIPYSSIALPDSIYRTGGRIYLRDGGGVVFLPDSSDINELPEIHFYFPDPSSITGMKLGDFATDGGGEWYLYDGSSWNLINTNEFSLYQSSVSSDNNTWSWDHHGGSYSGSIGIKVDTTQGLILSNGGANKVLIELDTSIISTKYYVDSLVLTGGGGIDGVGVANKLALWASADSLTYDSLYFNPTNHILGLGTNSPTATGGSFGYQIHGGSFSSLRLTNSSTGATSTDGTSIYSYADSLYLSNLENGIVSIATNSVERGRFDSNGFKVDALKSGTTAPTTSGTLVKVVTDANGRFSFQTNNTGTVTSHTLALGSSGTSPNISGTNPVTSSGTTTINLPTASSSNTGVLSSTDWSTFNNKLGSLNGLTASTQTFAKSTTGSDFTITSSSSTHTFGLPYDGSTVGLRLGYQSVLRNNSVAVGVNCMGSSGASAGNNVAIGNDVLRLAGSTGSGGTNNVGLGFQSLYSLTTGLSNFGLGTYALANVTSGQNNIAIGTIAGLTLTTQSENTMIGYESGRFNTGSANIFIGYQSGRSETSSNRLYIENTDSSTPLIGGDFSSNRVGINLAVGSLARTLDVNGEVRIRDLVTDTPTLMVGADADGDLTSIYTGTGLLLSGNTLSVNGVGTVTSIATNNGITGGTITTSGTVGLTGQALALHNLATNGLIARTGSGTVAARTIENGSGVLITNGDGVSGNPSLFNVICSHGQLYNTGNLTGQTLDGTYREIDFTSKLESNMTLSTTGNSITIPQTGTYEITYTFTYNLNASGTNTIYFNLYQDGANYGYNGETRSRSTTASTSDEITLVHRSFIAEFTASDVLEMYYQLQAGSASTISFYNLNFTAKRLK